MKFLREPLFHFAVGGAVLFVAYAWLNNGDGTTDRPEISINDGHLRWITATWSSQWRREPSKDELHGLVADLVKEELLAREARALGLDQDDTIIRRRLAQKMAFLIEDTARIAEPNEEDLRQLYDAHQEKFRREARVSFVHAFFSSSKRADAAADANRILAASKRLGDADIIDQGDQSLLASEFKDSNESDIAAQFGSAFAGAVATLEPGKWNGPIESAYGLHLVRASKVVPATVKTFAEAKTEVLEQWREEQQREYEARYFAELLKKYDIVTDASVGPIAGPLVQLMEGDR
jgi:parvulin-like peptidyl-prolyl isomerase